MKITVTIDIPDEELSSVELRDDGDPQGDSVAALWCQYTGVEAVGGLAWEQFYEAVKNCVADRNKMNGNPDCDCWEKSLWYLCCGSTEWDGMIMEAEADDPFASQNIPEGK